MEQAQTRKGEIEGKPNWSLVDFDAMRHLAPHYAGGWQGANWEAMKELLAVLEFGAKKYSPNGWKKGYNITVCAKSLLRHIIAASQGEKQDSESGLSHYGHVMCNLMFMSYWLDYRPELDDRHTVSVSRDTYVREFEPVTESEAIEALLEIVGGFLNGINYDPQSELHLLGHAMYYTCQAFAFSQSTITVKP